MPAPQIKICGIKTAEALDAAIARRASHVGFNFYAPSPRFLALDELAKLSEQAEGKVQRVGVFVDPDDAAIAAVLAAAKLDAIQLHGSESPERAARLRNDFGLPVWKALPVTTADDVARAATYAGAADFILFDAKTPKGTLPGGMGLSFDWTLLAGLRLSLPWGLAGGLTPDNVAEAVQIARPPLVDTSSGVESAPGVKDAARIAAFCAAVRAA